jgi:hypothetical protein
MELQPITPRRDPQVAALTTLPARSSPAIDSLRPKLYLVGEMDRSSPRPPTTAGRTSISINGRWHALRGKTATFAQLLRIAFPDQRLDTPEGATMTFRHGIATWPAGSLTSGDIIELVDGLSINANATSAS